MHEDAIVGVLARASYLYGSLDADGAYVAAPRGAAEVDMEQDILIALRPFRGAQASLSIPIVETYRQTGGASEASGGVGDITYGMRYDFIGASEASGLPGIAALAALTLPTGTPPESASKPLATDATGTGSVQGALGLSIERESGHSVFNLTGSVTIRGPRQIGAIEAQDGLELTAFGAGGYVFTSGSALLMTLTYTIGLAGTREGVAVEGGGHARARAGLAFGHALSSELRLQGGAFVDLPIPRSGYAEPLGVGLSIAALSPWM